MFMLEDHYIVVRGLHKDKDKEGNTKLAESRFVAILVSGSLEFCWGDSRKLLILEE